MWEICSLFEAYNFIKFRSTRQHVERSNNSFDIKRNFSEIYVCSVKDLHDDQDELRKIFIRFSGSTRPLSFLRKNLSVKEFVKILNFFPDLGKQVSCGSGSFFNADIESTKSEREILIFFGESENVIATDTSSKKSSLFSHQKHKFSSIESFSSENESFFEVDANISEKYSSLSSDKSLISSMEDYFSEITDENQATSSEFELDESKSEMSDAKAPLIPETLPESSFQGHSKKKLSNVCKKSQTILLMSVIVVATFLVMRFISYDWKTLRNSFFCFFKK